MSNIKYCIGILMIFIILPFSSQASDALIEEFDVSGLKVILKHSEKEVTSVRFFIRGGKSNYSKEHEGIEQLALTLAVDGGTSNMSKDQFKTEIEQIGTSLTAESSYDQGNISMVCLDKYWLKSWSLFTDAIRNPLLAEDEFNLLKEKMIADAKQEESDPDTWLRLMSFEQVFAGKNYANRNNGSPASLTAMSLSDVKAYYENIMTKSQCFIVVVGNVTRSELTSMIQKSFGDLPKGSYKPTTPNALSVKESKIHVEDRDIATNYMRGYLSAPNVNSAEATAMKIAMNIFRDRLFIEVRTKRNLSYAPYSGMSDLKNPYVFLYASTDSPAVTANVMINELNKIRTDGFSEKELKDMKGNFLTRHYMQQETNADQSLAIGEAEVQGNWQTVTTLVEEVFALTLDDLNNVVDKYFKGIHWVYLGDPAAADDPVFSEKLTD